jgi:hypothetical protein
MKADKPIAHVSEDGRVDFVVANLVCSPGL